MPQPNARIDVRTRAFGIRAIDPRRSLRCVELRVVDRGGLGSERRTVACGDRLQDPGLEAGHELVEENLIARAVHHGQCRTALLSLLRDEETSVRAPSQEPMQIGSVDVEQFSRNLARLIEEGGRALAAYMKPREEGRAFIQWLTEFATQPQFCYSHPWREGDMVIWDNRAVLHRATAYDTTAHKRLMQRTTVSGGSMTTAQPERYELAAE